ASGALDRTVRIWDIHELDKAPTLLNAALSLVDVPALSELADQGTLLIEIAEHQREVDYVEWSMDGQYLLSTSDDQTIRVYKVENNGRFVLSCCKLIGHTHNICSATFFTNNIIISCSEDKSIRLFDIQKHKQGQYQVINNVQSQQGGNQSYIYPPPAPSQTPQVNQMYQYRSTTNRFWCIAKHKRFPHLLAAGHDQGMIVFKLFRERPPYEIEYGSNFMVIARRECDFNIAQNGGSFLIGNLDNKIVKGRDKQKGKNKNEYNIQEYSEEVDDEDQWIWQGDGVMQGSLSQLQQKGNSQQQNYQLSRGGLGRRGGGYEVYSRPETQQNKGKGSAQQFIPGKQGWNILEKGQWSLKQSGKKAVDVAWYII
ncbi:MAG: hypothetical protein EZS28_026380, partial [Streblomastix strix]